MADITEVDYIWKNGEMLPWAEATTHILSHSLHYGSGVFEGIRCYQNPETKRSYVFRLRDHMERLHRSCKIALIDLPYTVDELCEATIELVCKNGLPSCYIRPIVYRGYTVSATKSQIKIVSHLHKRRKHSAASKVLPVCCIILQVTVPS